MPIASLIARPQAAKNVPSLRSPVFASSESMTSALSEGPSTAPPPVATPKVTVRAETAIQSPAPSSPSPANTPSLITSEMPQTRSLPKRCESGTQIGKVSSVDPMAPKR